MPWKPSMVLTAFEVAHTLLHASMLIFTERSSILKCDCKQVSMQWSEEDLFQPYFTSRTNMLEWKTDQRDNCIVSNQWDWKGNVIFKKIATHSTFIPEETTLQNCLSWLCLLFYLIVCWQNISPVHNVFNPTKIFIFTPCLILTHYPPQSFASSLSSHALVFNCFPCTLTWPPFLPSFPEDVGDIRVQTEDPDH